jgi:hypothetical protein
VSALAYVHEIVLPAALKMLPFRMDTSGAQAMLLAICLQESAALHRRQARGGPARSLWQFEIAGVRGVLNHPSSGPLIRDVLGRMGYNDAPETSHVAMVHNDVLACCYARCLLWTHPRPLPAPDDENESFGQYLACWRPGKPRPADWAGNYAEAWALVMPRTLGGDDA